MNFYTAICCIFIALAASNGAVGQDFTSPTNVALGQTATQSSLGWNGSASYAVDGNKDDYYYNWSCTHTNHTVNHDHWWQVELDQLAEIFQVKIQNRDSYGTRLTDLDILIGPTADDLQLCYYFEGPGANSVAYTLNCSQPLIGKYIKIEKRNDTQDLTLCEVEVMGWPLVAGCSDAGDQNGTYRTYPCGADGEHVFAYCRYDADGTWIM